jgi:hypothetical protein
MTGKTIKDLSKEFSEDSISIACRDGLEEDEKKDFNKLLTKVKNFLGKSPKEKKSKTDGKGTFLLNIKF